MSCCGKCKKEIVASTEHLSNLVSKVSAEDLKRELLKFIDSGITHKEYVFIRDLATNSLTSAIKEI